MKRLLIALLIFVAGGTVVCALRINTTGIHEAISAQTAAWQTQTQQLATLLLEKQSLTEHWSETKQALASLPPPASITQLAEKVLGGATSEQLSAAETEQLLAELGFNWNTSGDYLIVSKKSLNGISFDALKVAKVTAVAEAALGISPTEKAALQNTLQQIHADRDNWVKQHIQREEPSGNVVAKYSLPADPEFAANQLASFTNSVWSTLDPKRAELFQNHSIQWLADSGLSIRPDYSKVPAELRAAMPALNEADEPQPMTLTVERYQAGDEWRMNYTLKQAGNTMTTSVSPWQPLPAAFKTLFPNGWADLAKAEGFELPKEFQKNKAR